MCKYWGLISLTPIYIIMRNDLQPAIKIHDIEGVRAVILICLLNGCRIQDCDG